MGQIWEIFPKKGILFVYTYAFSMSLIVFNLTFQDILYIVAIELISFKILFPVLEFIFLKLYPQFKTLKKSEKEIIEEFKSIDVQQNFYETLSSFPTIRSTYSIVSSLIKVLPVGLYISYSTPIPFNFYVNLLFFYLIDLFVILFCSGHLFIQIHEVASNFMEKLRTTSAWEKNYQHLKPNTFRDSFSFFQNMVLSSMLLSLVGITYIITKYEISNSYNLLFFYVSALSCAIYIQIAFKNYFTNSLNQALNFLNQNFTDAGIQSLPLHTSSMIAGFEYAINQMGIKISTREKEITNWLNYESEQFHFRSLGQVAALVAHDIKTPLNVIKMSLDNILEKDESANKNKYFEILDRNLNQALRFTKTLMTYLRGDQNDQRCSFSSVHSHLISLIQTQVTLNKFDTIEFEVTDDLLYVEFAIRELDAMHVFYNIYQNAIKSILEESQGNPRIKIFSELVDKDNIKVFIWDNGKGLSSEDFNQIVNASRFSSNHHFKSGLGLRITKNILNNLGGDLNLAPSDYGACFEIILPHFSSSRVDVLESH